ncbi:hypothetical protein TrRE_jg13609 [Triparma retinervis]|uniref:Uncharacterized protein n=1 Tax=Triparma retinervis TaxID=2557542 RepID=A0A9W7A6V7_9STRA|nr:hypothetical protein TrRE_jg13609 [Triparma retinervis]
MPNVKGDNAGQFNGIPQAYEASGQTVYAQPVQATIEQDGPPQYGASPAYGAPPSYSAQPVQAQAVQQQGYTPSYPGVQLATYPQPAASLSYGMPTQINSAPQGQPAAVNYRMPAPVSSVPQNNNGSMNNGRAMAMGFAAAAGGRSQAAKQREFQSRMCVPCCLIFFAFSFIIGGVSLGAAMDEELAEAKALKPDEDFEYLGLTCDTARIAESYQDVDVCVEHRGGDSNDCTRWEETCEDIYKLYITWEGSGSTEYFVDETRALRQGDFARCSANKPKDTNWNRLEWEVGQDLECWKPADLGHMADDMHEAYECPNDECIKIDDPAGDVAEHIQTIEIFIIVADGMTGIGVFMLVSAMCCCCRAFQGKRY